MEGVKKRYKRGYQFLAKNSSDKAVIADYLKNEFHKHWKPKKNKIEVLDIGCAEGDITSCLLVNICFPYENVRLTLIEPSELLLSQALKQIYCETVPLNVSYEQYVFNTGNPSKYDLVFSCHSIYHTGLESIQQMYSSLNNGGALLIIVSSSDDPFIKIKELFPKTVTISGDSVMDELKRLGYKKVIKDSKRKILDVKNCVDDSGDMTEDGKDLSSLLFYKEYEEFTVVQQNAVLDFFKNHTGPGGIEYYNDFIWVLKS